MLENQKPVPLCRFKENFRMFESDDFDQVLSQFDFPDVPVTDAKSDNSEEKLKSFVDESSYLTKTDANNASNNIIQSQNKLANEYEDRVLFSSKHLNSNSNQDTFISPKHTKRKIINSHFDHKSKRKFPGPAGLLTGTLDEHKDETVCQIELLSQDIEFSQNNLRRDIFESPLWCRLLEDTKLWNLHNIDPIKTIKQQALAGNLRRRKAQTVTAFVENVDRSVTDPLIILRDSTGHIKCTLHRDAWSTFSPYLVSEYCALVLWKPTVLTTGSAFKKHYLNITLSNICAIYSSTVLKEDENPLPDGYEKVYEEDFTVIKTKKSPNELDSSHTNSNGQVNEETNLIEDLDSFFSDDLF